MGMMEKQNKNNNTLPDYYIEKTARKKGFKSIVGVDESGYGPGAGPVVAGAVRIPNGVVEELLLSKKIKDSKKLTEKRREEAYEDIIKVCDWGIGIINNDIIDEINILEATKLAMQMAIKKLKYCDYVLVDGIVVLNTPYTQMSIIKGDNKSISIAAASIVAKVTRDRIMCDLHKIFPIYNWNKNKGYLTRDHIQAIKKYGITEFHRLSFKKVGR
jgi:ribonuclease HII